MIYPFVTQVDVLAKHLELEHGITGFVVRQSDTQEDRLMGPDGQVYTDFAWVAHWYQDGRRFGVRIPAVLRRREGRRESYEVRPAWSLDYLREVIVSTTRKASV